MRSNKFMKLAGALLLIFSLCVVANAQGNRRWERQQRWEYLGEANVDGRNDHDRISVGRSDGRFREIQLRVQRGPIEFHRVVLHYANGGDDEVPVREHIRAGSQTRPIDLRGGDRAISSVEIWYARGNWRSRQPRVQLFGR